MLCIVVLHLYHLCIPGVCRRSGFVSGVIVDGGVRGGVGGEGWGEGGRRVDLLCCEGVSVVRVSALAPSSRSKHTGFTGGNFAPSHPARRAASRGDVR